MDFVVYWASGLTHPWLTAISLAFDKLAYFIFPLLFIAYWRALPSRRWTNLFVGLFVVLLATALLKDFYQEPRPCQNAEVAQPNCPPPNDYGFPSGHTAFAFLFVATALGTPAFGPCFALALFTAFSRMQLGFHDFTDVMAGVAVGITGYAMGDKVVELWAGVK